MKGQHYEVQRHRSAGFTIVPNDWLPGSPAGVASYRDLGVLVWLHSRPPGWRFSTQRMTLETGEGRDAVRTAMSRLVTAGYARQVTVRDPGGQFHSGWQVTDTAHVWRPETPPPAPDSPAPDNPAPVTQAPSVSTEVVITEVVKKETDNPLLAALARPQGRDRFEEFWEVYPRKIAKKAAHFAWVRALREASAEQVLAGARRYADDPNREEGFTAHAATWLNQGRWEDEPLPARGTGRMGAGTAAVDLARQVREASGSTVPSVWDLNRREFA